MMLIIISTLYSCEKENPELSQKNNYNFKNDNISYSFNKMNKNGTIDTTLNKFIDHFKDYDKKSGIANKISLEFGLPAWNLSLTMKDEKGLFTIFTPIVNEIDSVTAIIIATEKNKKTTFFRIINKETPQNKLTKIGDKNRNSFTLYTLKGIFNSLQKNVGILKKSLETENLKIKSFSNSSNSSVKKQSETLTYTTCWMYITADKNYNTIIDYQCTTNVLYFEVGGTEGSGSNYLLSSYSGIGGASLSDSDIYIDQSLILDILGPTPIKVYKTICNGVNSMWNYYPNNETQGYITPDGQILLTNITSFSGGSVAGLYKYENSYYYPYPKSGGDIDIPGTKSTSDYYFVPVIASIHTHTPCRIDNTDGISNRTVSDDDLSFSKKYPGLINYVIGCGAVANFSGDMNKYYNIKTSSQSSLCNFILK